MLRMYGSASGCSGCDMKTHRRVCAGSLRLCVDFISLSLSLSLSLTHSRPSYTSSRLQKTPPEKRAQRSGRFKMLPMTPVQCMYRWHCIRRASDSHNNAQTLPLALENHAQAPPAFLDDTPPNVHRTTGLDASFDGTATASTVCSALRHRKKLAAASTGKAVCDGAVGGRLRSGRGASRRRRRPSRSAMGCLPRPPRSSFGDDAVSDSAVKDVRCEGACRICWLCSRRKMLTGLLSVGF